MRTQENPSRPSRSLGLLRGRQVTILLVIALVLLAVTGLLLHWLGGFLVQSARQFWDEIYVYAVYMPVKGTVITDGRSPPHTVRYRYTVEGADYESARLHASPILSLRQYRKRLAGSVQAGQPVTVWVHPRDPETSVLFRTPTVVPLSIGLLPLALVTVLSVGIGMEIHRGRARREYLRRCRRDGAIPGARPLSRRQSGLIERDGDGELVFTNRMPLRFLLLISILLAATLTVIGSVLTGEVFLAGLLPASLGFLAVALVSLLLLRRRYTRVRISEPDGLLRVERRRLFGVRRETLHADAIAPPVLEWRFGGIRPAPTRGRLYQPYELYFALLTVRAEPVFVSRVWRTSEQGGVRLLARRCHYLLTRARETSHESEAT